MSNRTALIQPSDHITVANLMRSMRDAIHVSLVRIDSEVVALSYAAMERGYAELQVFDWDEILDIFRDRFLRAIDHCRSSGMSLEMRVECRPCHMGGDERYVTIVAQRSNRRARAAVVSA